MKNLEVAIVMIFIVSLVFFVNSLSFFSETERTLLYFFVFVFITMAVIKMVR